MSHFHVLVVGESAAHELAPFRDHIEVAPYLHDCHCRRRRVEGRREYVAAATPDCRWCGGSGMFETTINPIGRWDWFIATNGLLDLVAGASRRPADVGWLHVGGYSPEQLAALAGDVDRARREDVIALESLVPYALVVDGVWHQADDRERWFPALSHRRELALHADWPEAYARLARAIAPHSLVTLVDCHG